jgi:hypothetical protein
MKWISDLESRISDLEFQISGLKFQIFEKKRPPAGAGGKVFARNIVRQMSQKSYRRANWITRGALWTVVILPKFAELNVRLGGPKKLPFVRL